MEVMVTQDVCSCGAIFIDSERIRIHMRLARVAYCLGRTHEVSPVTLL